MLSQEIKDRAFRILEQRDHSEAELREKLVRKGIDKDDAAECAAWLTELGIIDDVRYAGAVVRHYSSKGFGAGRIRAELAKRGVDRSLWDEALEELPETNAVLDAAVCAKLREMPDRNELKKFTDRLLRRGFSWGEIREALDRNRAEEGLRY